MLEVRAVQAQAQQQHYLLVPLQVCHSLPFLSISTAPGKGLPAALGNSLAWGQSSGRAGSATLGFPGLTLAHRGGAGQLWENAPHQNFSHNELEQNFGSGHRHRWEIFTVGVSHLTSSLFNTGAAGGCWKRISPRLIILRNSDRC